MTNDPSLTYSQELSGLKENTNMARICYAPTRAMRRRSVIEMATAQTFITNYFPRERVVTFGVLATYRSWIRMFLGDRLQL